MKPFITQAIDGAPQVLVISEKHVLQETVCDFFRQKKLQVQCASYRDLSTIEQSRGEYYKIVWLVPDLLPEQDAVPHVVGFLQNREEPTLIITSQRTVVKSSAPEFQEYIQIVSQEQKLLAQLRQYLTSAHLFIATDLLWAEGNYREVASLLATLQGRTVHFLNSSIVLSPNLSSDFSQKVLPWLIKPKLPPAVLFSGPELKIAALNELLRKALGELQIVCKELSLEAVSLPSSEDFDKKEHTHSPAKNTLLSAVINVIKHQVEKQPVSPSRVVEEKKVSPEVPTQKVVPEVVTPSLEKRTVTRITLDPKPISIPPTQPTQVIPAAMKQTRKINIQETPLKKRHVVPHRIPRIENRLKKYERTMEYLKQQQEATRYLTPLSKKAAESSQVIEAPPEIDQQEKYLDQTIQEVFGKQRTEQKVVRLKKKVLNTAKTQRKQKYQHVFLKLSVFAGTVSSVVFLGFFVFLFSKQQVLSHLGSTFTENQPLVVSQKNDQSLNFWGNALSSQVNLYRVVAGKESFPESAALGKFVTQVAATQDARLKVNQDVEKAMAIFLGKKQENIFPLLVNISAKTQEMYKQLSYIQTELNAIDPIFLSEKQHQQLDKFTVKLQEFRKQMGASQQVQQLLPSLLAEQSKKTYIIFLENNQELRATGGLFHTFALVTVENGSIIDYQTFEVSQIEAMVKGKVAAPPELQKYLGTSNLTLGNTNWDPNFPASASQASWFVENALGRKADGIIAMNLFTLQDILRELGPVDLPEYNEVITDKNILERVEFHSEINLVNSSKSDYLTSVFTQVFEKIMASPPEKAIKLLAVFYNSFADGQAFIYLPDQSENEILSGLGWVGEVATPQCPTQFNDVPCTVDSIMQVESNVGANKANYAIERTIEQEIEVGKTQRRHTRTIQFHNTATTNSWPLGAYRNYLRFFVPNDAQLESVSIDGQPVPSSEITTLPQNEKISFGFLVDVPTQKTVEVKVVYVEKSPAEGPFSYMFFDQKQAGTPEDTLKITLKLQDGLKPLVIAPEAKVNGKTVSFTLLREKHSFVGVKMN
jgi:hypothetical protein